MELVLSLACESASTRPDGRLDIKGVFAELYAPGFPAKQDRMTVVFVLEWEQEEAGEQAIRADLRAPDGSPVLTIQGHTDVSVRSSERAAPQTRLILPIENVIFPVPGVYRFDVTASGTTVCALKIFIGKIPDPSRLTRV